MRCPSCGGYSFDEQGKCKYCGSISPEIKPIPKSSIPTINLEKFHELAIKEVANKIKIAIPLTSECLECHKQSLFYNSIYDQFECLYSICAIHNKPIVSHTEDYANIILSLQENNLLLPIELTELEYDIYKNEQRHSKNIDIETRYSFKIIIKY